MANGGEAKRDGKDRGQGTQAGRDAGSGREGRYAREQEAPPIPAGQRAAQARLNRYLIADEEDENNIDNEIPSRWP